MTEQSGFKLVSELVSLALKRGLWDHIVQHQHNANHMCNKGISSSHVKKSKKKSDFPPNSRYKNCCNLNM